MAKENKKKNKISEQQQEEMRQQKKKFTLLAFALVIAGAILMVGSAGLYSSAPNLYQLAQTICYFLVCLGGVAFAYCSKYEVDKQKKNNVQMMGLVFIIVAGGRLLSMFFNAMF